MHDLTALNSNGLITIDYFQIHSNSEYRLNEYKIGHGNRSCGDKSVKEARKSGLYAEFHFYIRSIPIHGIRLETCLRSQWS